MTEKSTPGRVTRRTVAKGAAWTVPAVVLAAPARAAVSSMPVPPPPEFHFSQGCMTNGNKQGTCLEQKFTTVVRFSISNPTPQPLVFQIVGSKFWIDGNTQPATFGPNHRIWGNEGSRTNCGPEQTTLGCGGYISITVQTDECFDLWITGPDLGNASSSWASFSYRWVTPSHTPPEKGDCTIIDEDVATPTLAIPNNNCANLADAVPLDCDAA